MYRGVQWAIVHGLQCWWVVKNGTQLSEHVCMHMHTHTHTHTHRGRAKKHKRKKENVNASVI